MQSSSQGSEELPINTPRSSQPLSVPSSNMLAASRISQLPSPTSTNERGGNYGGAPRYGAQSSTAFDDRSPLMGSSGRLPSLMELLHPPEQQQQQRQGDQPPLQPPPPPPPLAAPSEQRQERPSNPERAWEGPPSHSRSQSSGGGIGAPPPYFAGGWRGGDVDYRRPMSQPVPPPPPPPPPTRPYNPSLPAGYPPSAGSISSPHQAGPPSSLHQQAPPPVQTSWNPSQSPGSAASSAAPSVTSLATAQRDRPSVSRKLLGEREVPGEGRVFVYDDGTKIPTTIDGEPVNGQWGMTKAGRPRKRMPQACIPCRQKKIKCDPGDGKCAQCEKSGKECQYSHGHRGQKSSPTSPRTTGPTTPTALEDRPILSPRYAGSSGQGSLMRKRRYSGEEESVHAQRASQGDMRWQGERLHKQPRMESSWDSPDNAQRSQQSLLSGPLLAQATRAGEGPVGFGCWATGTVPEGFVMEDPFVVERAKADRYLTNFFERINNGTYCVFPRTFFIEWARSGRPKTGPELMTLHAILANGALSSVNLDDEARDDSERYLRIARMAIETSPARQGLELVLAKLIAAHVYVVHADMLRLIEISDVSRAVSLLKYELNERIGRPDHDGRYVFGMTRYGVEELYRRTEWLAFMVDRFISINFNHPLTIRKEDIYLQLPCDEEDYDRQVATRAPYFDSGVISRSLTETDFGHRIPSAWAYFLQALSFASDVWTAAIRAEWQDPAVYPGNCDAFVRDMGLKLDRWYGTLPLELRLLDGEAIEASVRKGTSSVYMAINALFHMAHMSLNRRVRSRLLPDSSADPKVRASIEHAERFLYKVKMLRARLTEEQRARGEHGPWLLPVPFLRQAILSAVDILTSCGQTTKPDDSDWVMGLCEAGAAAMEQLVIRYASCRPQYDRMTARLRSLRNFLSIGPGETMRAKSWVCHDSIDADLPKRMDLFYAEGGEVCDSVLKVRQIGHGTMPVEVIRDEEYRPTVSWGPSTATVAAPSDSSRP